MDIKRGLSKPFPCPYCSLWFENVDLLSNHLVTNHPGRVDSVKLDVKNIDQDPGQSQGHEKDNQVHQVPNPGP